ncbi:TPA: DNA-packaging protein FI [Escherichia coli]
MTKEQMVERLQELADILGREPDISGSKAEIEQRLAEWEEEASALTDDEEASGDSSEKTEKVQSGNAQPSGRELQAFEALTTLHIDARNASGQRVAYVLKGGMAYTDAKTLEKLVADRLAKRVY